MLLSAARSPTADRPRGRRPRRPTASGHPRRLRLREEFPRGLRKSRRPGAAAYRSGVFAAHPAKVTARSGCSARSSRATWWDECMAQPAACRRRDRVGAAAVQAGGSRLGRCALSVCTRRHSSTRRGSGRRRAGARSTRPVRVHGRRAADEVLDIWRWALTAAAASSPWQRSSSASSDRAHRVSRVALTVVVPLCRDRRWSGWSLVPALLAVGAVVMLWCSRTRGPGSRPGGRAADEDQRHAPEETRRAADAVRRRRPHAAGPEAQPPPPRTASRPRSGGTHARPRPAASAGSRYASGHYPVGQQALRPAALRPASERSPYPAGGRVVRGPAWSTPGCPASTRTRSPTRRGHRRDAAHRRVACHCAVGDRPPSTAVGCGLAVVGVRRVDPGRATGLLTISAGAIGCAAAGSACVGAVVLLRSRWSVGGDLVGLIFTVLARPRVPWAIAGALVIVFLFVGDAGRLVRRQEEPRAVRARRAGSGREALRAARAPRAARRRACRTPTAPGAGRPRRRRRRPGAGSPRRRRARAGRGRTSRRRRSRAAARRWWRSRCPAGTNDVEADPGQPVAEQVALALQRRSRRSSRTPCSASQRVRDRRLQRRAGGEGQQLLGGHHERDQVGRPAHPPDLPAGDREGLAGADERSACARPCPGSVASGTCVGAVEGQVLVDLVGDDDQVVLDRHLGDRRQLGPGRARCRSGCAAS